jgi:hypothetical protein
MIVEEDSIMEWKDISGAPYKVSEYGDVIRTEINKANGRGLTSLKHRILRSGYHRVLLCYNRKQIDKYIHRLVAEAEASSIIQS